MSYVNDEHKQIYHSGFMHNVPDEDMLGTLYVYRDLIVYPETYWAILRDAWVQYEFNHHFMDYDGVDIISELFGYPPAERAKLMNTSELATFKALPSSITIYRGIEEQDHLAWSWTLDNGKAEWFARRFGKGYVITGTVRKANAIAYLDNRGEGELIAPPKQVRIKSARQVIGYNPSKLIKITDIIAQMKADDETE